MKFHHLIEKIAKFQFKIDEHMGVTVDGTPIPEDLLEKAAAADEWIEAMKDVKLGEAEVPTMSPNIDAIMNYAIALDNYKDIFTEKTQAEITQYNEYVDELFQQVKDPAHPM